MSKMDEVTEVLPETLRKRMIKLEREESNLPLGGSRVVVMFENGYGAVILTNQYSYGGDQGLWEISVLDSNHDLISTPINQGILGWLSAEDVVHTLDKISTLTEEDFKVYEVQKRLDMVQTKYDQLCKALCKFEVINADEDRKLLAPLHNAYVDLLSELKNG